MKIDSKALLSALKKLRPAISPKPTNPILDSFLINGNKLIATNLGLTIIQTIPVTHTGEPFTLNYNETLAICSNISGDLTITPELITAGKTKYKLGKPHDASTFPLYEPVESNVSIKVSASLVESLKKAAMCVNENRLMNIGNVLLKANEGLIKVCALDGTVAYIDEYPGKDGVTQALMIPVDPINALDDIDYTMKVNSNKISFESKTSTIIGTLYDGVVADIEKLFVQSVEQISIDRNTLVDKLREVTVYDIEPKLSIEISPAGFSLKVSSEEKEVESFLEVTNDLSISTIILNARSLLKLISLLPEKAESINIGFTSSVKPIVISCKHYPIKMIAVSYAK